MQKKYKPREKKWIETEWDSPRRNPNRAVRSGLKASTSLNFSDDELNSDGEEDDERDHTWTSVNSLLLLSPAYIQILINCSYYICFKKTKLSFILRLLGVNVNFQLKTSVQKQHKSIKHF